MPICQYSHAQCPSFPGRIVRKAPQKAVVTTHQTLFQLVPGQGSKPRRRLGKSGAGSFSLSGDNEMDCDCELATLPAGTIFSQNATGAATGVQRAQVPLATRFSCHLHAQHVVSSLRWSFGFRPVDACLGSHKAKDPNEQKSTQDVAFDSLLSLLVKFLSSSG